MSIVEHSSSTSMAYQSPLTESPGTNFRKRQTAWKMSGRAHERAGQQRLILVAMVPVAIEQGATVADGLFFS